jgi:alkanesulfonate monooxygenase SsuD/methylene tetrahydromethanopterin reductase-like flavin-dependent oxidoreductase (luciferase family)
VCLVIQRDTIQTAKLAASLDQVSKGRFLFGIGCGWNAEEMEDHGTVYETRTLKMREQIEAMKEIWTKEKPGYHGDIVKFPPMMINNKQALPRSPRFVGVQMGSSLSIIPSVTTVPSPNPRHRAATRPRSARTL